MQLSVWRAGSGSGPRHDRGRRLSLIAEVGRWKDAALRNVPGGVGVAVRRVAYRRHFQATGRRLVVQEGVVLQGLNTVTVGDDVALSRGSSIYAERGCCKIGNRFG